MHVQEFILEGSIYATSQFREWQNSGSYKTTLKIDFLNSTKIRATNKDVTICIYGFVFTPSK